MTDAQRLERIDALRAMLALLCAGAEENDGKSQTAGKRRHE